MTRKPRLLPKEWKNWTPEEWGGIGEAYRLLEAVQRNAGAAARRIGQVLRPGETAREAVDAGRLSETELRRAGALMAAADAAQQLSRAFEMGEFAPLEFATQARSIHASTNEGAV